MEILLPQAHALSMPLEEALQKRRSNRNFSTDPIEDEKLAALLWAGAGINRETGDRTTPCTRHLKAVDIYVCRTDGVYRYNASEGTLEQTIDQDARLASTEGQEDIVSTAPITLVFVADQEKAKIARPTGVYVDAGAMAQSVSLAAAALGLVGVIRASFDHSTLAKAMALPEHLEPVLAYTLAYVE